jgi:nitroreductase
MKRDEKKSVPEIEEAGAVFCAVQNMYLTATAYHVGCYLSTGGITYFPEARKAFGLSDEDRIIGFLHVGIPKPATRTGRRKPVAEKTTWVKE